MVEMRPGQWVTSRAEKWLVVKWERERGGRGKMKREREHAYM